MVNVLLASISFSAYEWIPYPVGMLISHCKKDPNIRAHYNFMEPEYRSYALEEAEFHQQLKTADILGLTNWVWNQNYNDQIAKLYKQYRPEGLVVYGGTNVPEDRGVSRDYAEARPYVDIFFCGPAEEYFRKFLIDLPQTGLVGVMGAFTHSEFHVVKDRLQYKNIELAMPYLDGVFDQIIKRSKDPLSAIFETNRGCPYGCAFCDWGGMTRSKIVRADRQLVKDTISYIMAHENIDRIELADANFGIFDVDVEYMQHMIDCKLKRARNINLTMGGFAKNGSPHVEKIMQMMHAHFDAYCGRKYVKISFQSHDPVVLETSNRSNIQNAKLYPMIRRFQDRGVDVDAEMIMGLPGDNQERWLNSIQRNMDLKINHQKSFALYVVPNTLMATAEYKEKYKIKTKKVLIPHDLYHLKSSAYHSSRTGGKIQTECDFSDPSEYQTLEFMYESFSFDSAELMRIYDVWFWFNTLYNAKVARDWMLRSADSAHVQFGKFMKQVDAGNMPFFKNLLEEFRQAVWNTIAKPEPVTKVKELFWVNFVVKFAFRGNEVFDIFENQETARAELAFIYPDINLNHFRASANFKDKIQLYFVGAEVV